MAVLERSGCRGRLLGPVNPCPAVPVKWTPLVGPKAGRREESTGRVEVGTTRGSAHFLARPAQKISARLLSFHPSCSISSLSAPSPPPRLPVDSQGTRTIA